MFSYLLLHFISATSVMTNLDCSITALPLQIWIQLPHFLTTTSYPLSPTPSLSDSSVRVLFIEFSNHSMTLSPYMHISVFAPSPNHLRIHNSLHQHFLASIFSNINPLFFQLLWTSKTPVLDQSTCLCTYILRLKKIMETYLLVPIQINALQPQQDPQCYLAILPCSSNQVSLPFSIVDFKSSLLS